MDDDCDGFIPPDEWDLDADYYTPCEGDCDDGNALAFPGGTELCNEIDDDCDGSIDEAAQDAEIWFEDADGDGYGDPGFYIEACLGPQGWVNNEIDCNDAEGGVHPGAPELCNGIDDDCSGSPGGDEVDNDFDGYLICEGDCDDGEESIHPAATEQCNGIDDDCDGMPGIGEVDADGDGWMLCEDDCDDTDPTVNTDADESLACEDGVDNDCDGEIDFDDEDCEAPGDDDSGDDDKGQTPPADDTPTGCECQGNFAGGTRANGDSTPPPVALGMVAVAALLFRRRVARG